MHDEQAVQAGGFEGDWNQQSLAAAAKAQLLVLNHACSCPSRDVELTAFGWSVWQAHHHCLLLMTSSSVADGLSLILQAQLALEENLARVHEKRAPLHHAFLITFMDGAQAK